MLHAHHRAIALISAHRDLKYLVRDYFALPRHRAIAPALLERGLGQADLVLALLRLRDQHRAVRPAAEALIAALVGHPITIGPPCLARYRDPAPYLPVDTSPRITYVAPVNPRQPSTEAHMRWCEYRVGRSVAQLRARGVTARDVRRVRARGWIRLSNQEEAHT